MTPDYANGCPEWPGCRCEKRCFDRQMTSNHGPIPYANEQEVTERQFFLCMGPLNVHPRPKGIYPYRNEFTTPDGRVLGRIMPSVTFDGNPKYYFVHKDFFK